MCLTLLAGSAANLDVANNQFSGALPSEVGLMENLDRLSLSGNFLSGPIPTEVGALALLRKFSLALGWPMNFECSRVRSFQDN